MNYRFKKAIQEELARLEALHLSQQAYSLGVVPSLDYASILKLHLKPQRVRRPFFWTLRFH